MTLFRRLAAALCAGLCFTAVPASATNYSIDFTDLWYIPAEAGWGFNVIQQGNTLFGTLFVYGNDQSTRWYVASGMTPQTAAAGQAKFGSKLYQTTGPYFGAGAFNPAQVVVTEVGDISITFLTATSAVLVYNVGTTTVTKNVTRQTFASNSPVGQYQGGIDALTSACVAGSTNGASATFLGFLIVNMNAQSAVTMQLNYLVLPSGQGTCNFNGTYSQQGRLGSIAGQWSCSINGGPTANSGTYSVSNLDIQVTGMSGVITAVDQFCTYNGRFGGLRTTNN